MLVHPQFDPIALSLGPLQIHWYGLTYLAAFGLFMLLAVRRVRLPWFAAAGWKRSDVEDMLFWGVVGVVLGGRLGYALFYMTLGDGQNEVAQHPGGLAEQPVDHRGRVGVGDRLAERFVGPDRAHTTSMLTIAIQPSS